MKKTPLRNPFPLEVRLLYIDCWTCWICGGNGQQSGGLEIHHIVGRSSDSAFNSSCLCKKCHEQIKHTQEEECMLFEKTLIYLKNKMFTLGEKEHQFVKDNLNRLLPAMVRFIDDNYPWKNP